MKTLIIDLIDPKRLGELVTASRKFCDKPDIVTVGKGLIPGLYKTAYQVESTVAANLVPALALLIKKEAYEFKERSMTTSKFSFFISVRKFFIFLKNFIFDPL